MRQSIEEGEFLEIAELTVTASAVGRDADYGGTGNSGNATFEHGGVTFTLKRLLWDHSDSKIVFDLAVDNKALNAAQKTLLNEVFVSFANGFKARFSDASFEVDSSLTSEYEFPAVVGTFIAGSNTLKVYEALRDSNFVPHGGTPGQLSLIHI